MSISAVAELAKRLQSFRDGIAVSPQWQAGSAMADTLATLRSRHRRKVRPVERARVTAAVTRYLASGQVERPEQVFDLCFGAAWLDAAGHGILADRQLRRQLFALAETAKGRARRLKAFRGLLFAYWMFPLHDAPPSAIEGWQELRDWLKRRYAEIGRHPARKPTWFKALAPHLHLLEENPCARYATALVSVKVASATHDAPLSPRGRGAGGEGGAAQLSSSGAAAAMTVSGGLDELQHAIDCLFIPAGSWLKTEAVMAQIALASQWPDAAFRERLDALIALATGAAGIRLTAAVTRRAVAGLVMRYARQREQAPHEPLFALALQCIGNPWRQRAAWEAELRDENGNACALSREMVGAWLKDRTIEAFFQDRGQPAARSDFWLPYSVFMQAIALASPWRGAEEQALLLHMGEALVVVPQDAEQPLEAYPWKALLAHGGARLFDRDTIDGATVAGILDPLVPAIRLHQGNQPKCERALRGVLF